MTSIPPTVMKTAAPHRKRSESLTIRLTPLEKEILLGKAAERDMSITQYMLWCSSRDATVNLRPLLKILKQIKDLLEASKKGSQHEEIYDLLDSINELYSRVMEAVRSL